MYERYSGLVGVVGPFMALATTIYVGGLPPSTDSASLAAVFAPRSVLHAVVVRSFGFVTFTSLSTSVLASQARLYPSPLQMLVSRAPSRSDIIWVNLERTISRRFFKTVLSVVFATFLTFLVATACAAISWAMTPGNIKKWDPFEKLLENFPYGEKGLAFIAPILIMIMVSSDTLWKCTASEFCMAAAD